MFVFLLPVILLVKYFIYSCVFTFVNYVMPTRVSAFKFGGIRILVGLFVGGFLFYFNMTLIDVLPGVRSELLYTVSVIFWIFIWAAEWYFCFRLAYGDEISFRLKRRHTLLLLTPAVLVSLLINLVLTFLGMISVGSVC